MVRERCLEGFQSCFCQQVEVQVDVVVLYLVGIVVLVLVVFVVLVLVVFVVLVTCFRSYFQPFTMF